MNLPPNPLRLINSAAPIRVCDNGGWTDTWFAEHGQIFNIGVAPCVEVQVAAYPRAARAEWVVLHAENYGERIVMTPGQPGPARHALLAAVLAEAALPEQYSLDITIGSAVPAGASTGTSAAVCVALLAALDALTPGRLTPHELAYAAHRVETVRLGQQSGIQDQLCAAYGGLNFIEMAAYPTASVTQLQLPDPLLWELERRLVLVFLGQAHSSSAVHQAVIAGLERSGGTAPPLEALRRAAVCSRDALLAGDLAGFGQAMIANTAAQQMLHPALIGSQAHQLIELAQAHGALGWKVNGAGGEGGSLTLLCGPSAHARHSLLRVIAAANPQFQIIPTTLARGGVRVWEASEEGYEPCCCA